MLDKQHISNLIVLPYIILIYISIIFYIWNDLEKVNLLIILSIDNV